MDRLLARTNFTAVFADNLVSAVGVMASIREAGLQIPHDISVIGLHDSPLTEFLAPPLTVVRMPLFEMGYEATKTFISLLKGETKSIFPSILPPEGLIKRASTDVPRKGGTKF